mmetsp:Transcript_58043/g.160626  ORF Transcript_58043/g.160626 Transcript_58043/m.160626 type:complete len:227 (+) Transcript_58043:208-888(+)
MRVRCRLHRSGRLSAPIAAGVFARRGRPQRHRGRVVERRRADVAGRVAAVAQLPEASGMDRFLRAPLPAGRVAGATFVGRERRAARTPDLRAQSPAHHRRPRCQRQRRRLRLCRLCWTAGARGGAHRAAGVGLHFGPAHGREARSEREGLHPRPRRGQHDSGERLPALLRVARALYLRIPRKPLAHAGQWFYEWHLEAALLRARALEPNPTFRRRIHPGRRSRVPC